MMSESAPPKKRKLIGRRLSAPPLLDTQQSSDTSSAVYTLNTGREVEFKFVHISAGDLAHETYVDPRVNARDQETLTRASLEPICQTLAHQQFFPAIGRRDHQGKVEIIDGSRRRAAALFIEQGLDILVAQAALSLEEARALAQAIQTAREHHLREIGLRLKLILETSQMNQRELAEREGLSAAKVTRALQAASVPERLLKRFPIHNELTYPDYRLLKEIADRLSSSELDALDEALDQAVSELSSDLPPDQYHKELIALYRRLSRPASPKSQPQVTLTPLWRFQEKNTYARMRQQGRSLQFEFNRIPKSLQSALVESVHQVLRDHLEEREGSETTGHETGNAIDDYES